MEYQVLNAADVSDLVILVVAQIALGWVPLGAIVVGRLGDYHFLQAMTKTP